MAEGYHFNEMKQQLGETLPMFMARVRAKGGKCDFGDMYDRMVKDRFMVGLRSESMRAHLFNKAPATAADALKQAISKQHNDNANDSMKSGGSGNTVNNVYMKRKGNNWKKGAENFVKKKKDVPVCSKCTLKGHLASDCRVICNLCKSAGHIKKFCPKSKNSKQKPGGKRTHQVDDLGQGGNVEPYEETYSYVYSADEVSNSSSEDNLLSPLCPRFDRLQPFSQVQSYDPVRSHGEYHDGNPLGSPVSCIPNPCVPVPEPWGSAYHDDNLPGYTTYPYVPESAGQIASSNDYQANHVSAVVSDCIEIKALNLTNTADKPIVALQLNCKVVHFELDTGAAITCISRAHFEKLNLPNCRIVSCRKLLRVANGQVVNVNCKAIVSVKYKGVSHGEFGLHVVEASFPTLLGRDWIRVL